MAQVGALRPLLRRQLSLDVHGLEELATVHRPVLLVANHSSQLDTAALVGTLPGPLRRRTVISLGETSGQLLASGWSVVVYPDGTPSTDGPAPLSTVAADLAIAHGVWVVPVGLRGTYAAMPRGRAWPRPGRPRVSVRYGAPLTASVTDTVQTYAARIEQAIHALVAEDITSWWTVLRAGDQPVPDPPRANWRRIWLQSEEPVLGRSPTRSRVWRQ